ncbi:SMC-Scp complex subunit ScpB [Lentzea sp.]|uniref:SMC-Scp complex subunit ScpB n=1 Tax=Lentzea sp. TaxID=56099 RepID=UPI002C6F0AD4|nr:SMC-Scp complex subunit ScpB [Lentzea sp.]HUQ60996.1 SMC-Scp complex subunit ScpB [Lentzea sp.]
MSEPLVGPDAAEIAKPGPAFDGGGTAAEPVAGADGAAEAGADGAAEAGTAVPPPGSSLSAGTDENGAADVEPVDGSAAEPGAVADAVDAADAAALETQLLAAAPEEVIEDSGLPDLSDDATFEAAIESVLLVVDSPIAEDQLSSALEQPVRRIKAALRTLSTRYTESGSGIDLRRAGDGWRFYTRDRFAPFVEKLLLDGQRAKLTRAALETLAVIAYRQPVTRARIAAVRGVNVDGVIRTLVARGLIEETGTDSDTGGILYRTTELFLERLGLSSLSDLPPIAPLLPEVDAIDDV